MQIIVPHGIEPAGAPPVLGLPPEAPGLASPFVLALVVPPADLSVLLPEPLPPSLLLPPHPLRGKAAMQMVRRRSTRGSRSALMLILHRQIVVSADDLRRLRVAASGRECDDSDTHTRLSASKAHLRCGH